MIHEKKHVLMPHERHARDPHLGETPLHLKERGFLGKNRSLKFAVGVSSALTALLLLFFTFSGIPLSIALPTSAPVWVGVSTLLQNTRR